MRDFPFENTDSTMPLACFFAFAVAFALAFASSLARPSSFCVRPRIIMTMLELIFFSLAIAISALMSCVMRDVCPASTVSLVEI